MLKMTSTNALVTAETIGSVVAYESMCRWIAESESLAECKDIADKSAALKEYARRVLNTEAERRASNVRLIAERRYGELLKELARATPSESGASGGRGNTKESVPRDGVCFASPYAEALAATGTTRKQADRYQALANVPKEVFDDALKSSEGIPTRAGVIAKNKAMAEVQEARAPVPRMPDDSLWLWGCMRDLEGDGYFSKDPRALLTPMTETMRADVARLAPLVADFFAKFEGIE